MTAVALVAGRDPGRPVRFRSKLASVLVLGLGLVVAGSVSPAAADPAGPTDHRSEIVAVDPPVGGLGLEVVGGDSFLQLTVAPGLEVVVLGYQEEPYLWFAPDGTVSENQMSPSTYLNQDRFGDATPRPGASADAEPEWWAVATDGRYAWHDHRIHWMLPQPPVGLSPGDEVLDGAVRLVVDGRDVEVRVVSTLAFPPSGLPAAIGGLIALLAVAGAWSAGGRWPLVAVALAAAVAATGTAAAAYWSVPSETGPEVVPVAMPVIALGLVVAGAAVPRLRAALCLAAGLELLVWAYRRRDHLDAAVLPTDAPYWLDRGLTAGVAVAALGVVVLALLAGALGPIGPIGPTGRPEPATGGPPGSIAS